MKSSQAEGKETEELEQLYENLQRDWDAYKHSNPTTSRRYSADSSITMKAIQLVQNSPRDLMSQLQATTEDLATQEIIGERDLKGRRLFEAMEGESEVGEDSEVRSLSFGYSEDELKDESNGSKESADCIPSSYSSSSSSSPFPSCTSVGKDKEVKAVKDLGDARNGGRCIVLFGGLAFALLIFAICMRSATSFGGYEMIPVPT